VSILVVAAHPDDEVLGCGASIKKWSLEGRRVDILIMAEGATARDNSRNRVERSGEIDNLRIAAENAGEKLGAASVTLLQFPDNRMDSVPLLDVIKPIEEQITGRAPEVVVTHHAADLNIDHKIVHNAVITACRPLPRTTVSRVLMFEVPSATGWGDADGTNSFHPNWYEDVSETIAAKIAALREYHEEMRQWPHARSYEAIEHLARWRGAEVGLEAAEAFGLFRQLTR